MIVKKIKNWIYNHLMHSKMQKHVQVFDNPKVNAYFEKNRREKRDRAYQFDDYNWNLYNEHYRGELEEISKEHCIKLQTGDYVMEEQLLSKKNTEIMDLHPNWYVLYETLLQLDPQHIAEIGCGSAMHLFNLQVLNPSIALTGFDRSTAQLNFSKELFPEFDGQLNLMDITLPLDESEQHQYDICYTQAVIMHLRTANNHVQALKNLFLLARNQVVLMENWVKHPFMEIIQKLYEAGEIKWPALYFYYRREPIHNKPHLMVCSSTQLDYPELTDYNLLLNH